MNSDDTTHTVEATKPFAFMKDHIVDGFVAIGALLFIVTIGTLLFVVAIGTLLINRGLKVES